MFAQRCVTAAVFVLAIGAGAVFAENDMNAGTEQEEVSGFPAMQGLEDNLMPAEELLTDNWWMMDEDAGPFDEFAFGEGPMLAEAGEAAGEDVQFGNMGFGEGPLMAAGQDAFQGPMAGGDRMMGGGMGGAGMMMARGWMQGSGGMAGGGPMMGNGGMMSGFGGRMGRGPMMGRGGMGREGSPGFGKIALYLRNAEKLKLTDDQVKKLKDLRTSFLKEAIDLRAKLATGRIELGELLDRENPDMNAVEKKVRANHDLDATLAVALLKTGNAAGNVLTADQRKAAKELGPGDLKDRPVRQGMFGGPGFGRRMMDDNVQKDKKDK